MRIAWDLRKAAANLRKHGVSFQEAVTALNDSLSITGADPNHSIGEFRWITFGISIHERLLVVAHSEEGGIIRIINARKARRAERRLYEEG